MVVAAGALRFSDGTSVPLLNSSMTNGTQGEVQTDATYSVVAQTLGDYAPGKVPVAGWIGSTNNTAFAFIMRQGLPIAFIPCGAAGVNGKGLHPVYCAGPLQPGDSVQVLPNASATRTCALTVRCSDNTQRCFVVTPSGAATNTLVDEITGNGIGATIQGKTITQAMCSSVDGIKLTSALGVVVLDAQGAVVGAISATDPLDEAPTWTPMNTKIELNYVAQCVTSS